MGKFAPPQTGIEIIEGLPGSGKSYYAVERLLKAITVLRRPVYTNLPLRMRVVRKYLQVKTGKPEMANYIRVLSKDHLERFLNRNWAYSQFREEVKRLQKPWHDRVIEEKFDIVSGSPILTGPDANWFPPMSLFVIDEIHRWYDQRNQDYDKRTKEGENPNLLNWLTMHRHWMHWIWIISQNRMQISLPWRRNCVQYIHAVDKRNIPIFWMFKVPIPAFFYEVWAAENDKERNPFAKPMDMFTRIPWLDDGLVFRFYDSFSHAGSPRRMRKMIERLREQVEKGDSMIRKGASDEEKAIRVDGRKVGDSVGGDWSAPGMVRGVEDREYTNIEYTASG